MAGGRPTLYNEELAALICERTATHTVGLNTLCEMYDDFPTKFTVNLWRYKYPEFSSLYARAKLHQADLLAEECIEIADTPTAFIDAPNGEKLLNPEGVARDRLRIDTRKWLASKLLPRQYGNEANIDASKADSLVEKILNKIAE